MDILYYLSPLLFKKSITNFFLLIVLYLLLFIKTYVYTLGIQHHGCGAAASIFLVNSIY
jgi:hypothetical protein